MGFSLESSPVEVDIHLAGYDGPSWEVAPFRHRSGWLMVAEARLMTPFGFVSETLVAAVSDHGEAYSPEMAARLLNIPAGFPRDAEVKPPESLADRLDALYWDFLGTTDLESLGHFEEAEAANDGKIASFEADCAAFEAKLWTVIRQLRAERRKSAVMPERRAEIDARLKRLLEMPDELAQGMREKLREMRAATGGLETAVMDSLTDHGELEVLYVVRWRARSAVLQRVDCRLPVNRDPGFTRHPWHDGGLAGRTLERLAQMRPFQHERDE
ncbi:hypothetical protein [Blastochloris sulfoviridis]|uniref:Uncharacterized protein n=1 Tax=Blastochloris sulfoviridis TaxID=50712 RepID=A0A5M6HHU4_9HYPH|nr:hypothetical protein [Blastochloris sulfoviridis]KAA5595397.1 hypothetical protein F1193_16710 [Blastochloris sulfoviridis]